MAKRAHEQIQMPVAVQVGKGAARGWDTRARHCLTPCGFKTEITQIAIEDVVVLQSAKVEVGQAVPVEVARRHAGAVEQHLVFSSSGDA